MSGQRHEVRAAVLASLAKHADGTFQSAGFLRRPNSLRFERKLLECVQYVEVNIEHKPEENPNAAAAVYPWLTVAVPKIDVVAVEMTGGDPTLLSPDSATLHQPIELVSPKGTVARWYLYQPDSVDDAIREFESYSCKWLFRFMDEYSSVEGIVSMALKRDERILHDQDQFLRIVAAMICSGRIEAAGQMLNERFGRPAMRRRFFHVFEFLKNALD